MKKLTRPAINAVRLAVDHYIETSPNPTAEEAMTLSPVAKFTTAELDGKIYTAALVVEQQFSFSRKHGKLAPLTLVQN